ncbi:GNAT family N-acetyltransferase [Arthrobacter sp. TMN-50]
MPRGGQSLGYLLAEHTTRPANPFRRSSSSVYVHHIAVAATAQHKGVGKLLMNAAVKMAQDNGAAAIRLDSWQFNDRAHGFFESQGFTPVNVIFERTLP